MPIGKKFGTNAVKQNWAITYFTSVLIDFIKYNELTTSYYPLIIGKLQV